MKTNNIPGVFLVTRPEEKSSDFIETLSLRGVKTRSLPMISVEPSNFSTDCEVIEQKILQLFKFDLVIFISTYAVNILDDLLNKYNFVWPPKLHCIAIGSQTAKAIKEKGWPVDENCFFDDSKHQQTSESLLLLPPLQNVFNKNIIIVRGRGGREFLSSILKNRGANVEYFELYSRTAKSYELNHLVEVLGIGSEEEKVTAILFASGETLQAFHQNIKKYKLFKSVRGIQIIVPSERLRKNALELGFVNVNCSMNASSTAFIEEIKNIVNIKI